MPTRGCQTDPHQPQSHRDARTTVAAAECQRPPLAPVQRAAEPADGVAASPLQLPTSALLAAASRPTAERAHESEGRSLIDRTTYRRHDLRHPRHLLKEGSNGAVSAGSNTIVGESGTQQAIADATRAPSPRESRRPPPSEASPPGPMSRAPVNSRTADSTADST